MNGLKSVEYVGVYDRKIDLFEGQYRVPDGISYNSYIIKEEKIAVLDGVDAAFADEWLGNIEASLGEREPDYLIVHHMEPDHSAGVAAFTRRYKNAVVVSSAKAFAMMGAFFGEDFADRRIVVGEGDTLSLGARTLRFITAPMVHWPEVIMSYDEGEKILFSADAFGKFGEFVTADAWADEARRYYIGIVGKYGVPVKTLLKKASGLDIAAICPLHGPVLTDDLGYYVSLYDKWASYTPEEDGVTVAYASVYGNTRRAAELLCDELRSRGCENVALFDLSRCDKSEAVASAFRYSSLVLASVTYNADVFPPMRAFIDALTERGFCRRRVGFIENGSWAPMARKVMGGMLEGAKDLTICESGVKITSALNDESRAQIAALADELLGRS